MNFMRALCLSPAKICARGAIGMRIEYKKNHQGLGGGPMGLPPTCGAVGSPFSLEGFTDSFCPVLEGILEGFGGGADGIGLVLGFGGGADGIGLVLGFGGGADGIGIVLEGILEGVVCEFCPVVGFGGGADGNGIVLEELLGVVCGICPVVDGA